MVHRGCADTGNDVHGAEPGRYRWRRAIAARGVLTSFVALAAIGHDGQPSLVSLWLLCAGLALAALSLHAIRKSAAPASCSPAARPSAIGRRRAAEPRRHSRWSWPRRRWTSCPCSGPTGGSSPCRPRSRAVLGYDPEEPAGRSGDDCASEDLPIILAMRNRALEADDVSDLPPRPARRPADLGRGEAAHRPRRPRRVAETHAIIRDVHERVEAQRGLAEAEERFRTAFEEGAAGWRS